MTLLICHPLDTPAAAARAEELRAALPSPADRRAARILPAGSDSVMAVAALCPEAVILTGYEPEALVPFDVVRAPCIWDMADVPEARMAAWLGQDDSRAAVRRALGMARSTIGLPRATALLIEDSFSVGLSSHDIAGALDACRTRVVVILGAGLGNMVYGIGMVRWISEQQEAPVDLVIHNRFAEGVTLFAGAPWLNAVYNGFDYLAGRDYRLMVSSVTGGAWRPPFEAERSLWLHLDYSYNEEGRFIHETQLNFLGLEAVFGTSPMLTGTPPLPFIRDIEYRHPGRKILGIANGQKTGTWTKREWPHMAETVARLTAEGWEVRSFGLPGEYVEGARDFTGIPMRDMLDAIAECGYFCSYDGGLCHIAEGIGVPTLWLFGSTGTVKNGPVRSTSRVLTSWRDCGPCLYKIDWLRCGVPECMNDLSIDLVVDALKDMHATIERDGYAPEPVTLNEKAVAYEAGSIFRQPPEWTRESYRTERLDAFGTDVSLRVQNLLHLLAAGDPIGAAANAAALIQIAPGDAGVRFLFSIVRQLHPGPTPMSPPLAEMDVPPFEASSCKAALLSLAQVDLTVDEQRFLLQAGLRYWTQTESQEDLHVFLRHFYENPVLVRNHIRPIQRYLERFSVSAEDSVQSIEFEATPSQQRMRRTLIGSPRAQLTRVAEEMDQRLALAPGTALGAALTPHIDAVPSARHTRIELQLGRQRLSLPRHSGFVALVPHVKVKNAPIGSSSNLILQHMERLAMLGLKPVVFTVGFDDIPPFWAMRNSVTFVQAHRRWSEAQWAEAFEVYGVTSGLSYHGVGRGLNLPGDTARTLTEVDMGGLTDLHGLTFEFPDRQCWTYGAPPLAAGAETAALRADELTLALAVPHLDAPRPPAGRPTDRPELLVTLNDARDLQQLLQVASVVPEVTFNILTPFLHRGIEKNVRMLPLKGIGAAEMARYGTLMQFSTRPAPLAAEALRWIEQGGALIAALDLGRPFAPDRLHLVERPRDLLAWREVIGRALGRTPVPA